MTDGAGVSAGYAELLAVGVGVGEACAGWLSGSELHAVIPVKLNANVSAANFLKLQYCFNTTIPP